MKITTAWDNDSKTIVRLIFQQGWSWDDLFANFHEAVEMLGSVDYKVDVILDARASVGVPIGFLAHMPMLLRALPPNLNRVVVVKASPVLLGMFDVINAVYRALAKRFCFVQTMEEAQEILQKPH